MDLPLKCYNLIGKVAYSPITELCAEGKYENCLEIDLEPLADCSITYYRWRWSEKYYEKEITEKEGVVIATEMMDNIKGIKCIVFAKWSKLMDTKNKLMNSKIGKPQFMLNVQKIIKIKIIMK